MPGKASLRSYSASNMGDTKPGTVGPEGIMDSDHFKIVMLESLGDDAIVRKLQDIFTPSFNRLTEAVDQLVKTNQLLRQQLQEKDATIAQLQQRCEALENKADDMEQRTRRGSMRIQGLPETGQGQVEDKILSLCNQDLRMDPPLQLEEIEVAHRLPRPRGRADGTQRKQRGPPASQSATSTAASLPGGNADDMVPAASRDDGATAASQSDASLPPRMVIVKFLSRRTKTRVMDFRKELKNIDKEKYQRPIYFQDDLTARRAKLAYQARQLKNTGKIVDTWVIDSKVMIKDKHYRIHHLRTEQDISQID